MRFLIFWLCTLLSGYGIMATASLVLVAMFALISHSGRIDWFVTLSGLFGAIAWIAYFRMGLAWIDDVRLGWTWPSIGTIAAVLALNGGGTLFLTEEYSPKLMLGPVAFTSPAIFAAIWMVFYHFRRQHNLPVDEDAQARQSV